METAEFIDLCDRLRIPHAPKYLQSQYTEEDWYLIEAANGFVVGFRERGNFYPDKKFRTHSEALDFLLLRLRKSHQIADEVWEKILVESKLELPDNPNRDVQNFKIPVLIEDKLETWSAKLFSKWNSQLHQFEYTRLTLFDDLGKARFQAQETSHRPKMIAFRLLSQIRQEAEAADIKVAVAGALISAAPPIIYHNSYEPMTRLMVEKITLGDESYQEKYSGQGIHLPLFQEIPVNRVAKVADQKVFQDRYYQELMQKIDTHNEALTRREKIQSALFLVAFLIACLVGMLFLLGLKSHYGYFPEGSLFSYVSVLIAVFLGLKKLIKIFLSRYFQGS